jgi:AraC-like DNA-binding protein
MEDIVPIHYGKTLEICVCDDLTGSFTINNKTYNLNHNNQAFVIAPYVLHSSKIGICAGTEYIIKFDFDVLRNFVDISNLLDYDNQRIEQFREKCRYYDEVLAITKELIEQDDNFIACIRLLISLLDVLRRDIQQFDPSEKPGYMMKNAKLRDIIQWTEKNYASKIQIEDVARTVGYSKSYFCTYFKRLAGKSYVDYLNHVRIYNACRMLRAGDSVSNVCEKIGYESNSYFIRLFKSIQGITPKQYREMSNQL